MGWSTRIVRSPQNAVFGKALGCSCPPGTTRQVLEHDSFIQEHWFQLTQAEVWLSSNVRSHSVIFLWWIIAKILLGTRGGEYYNRNYMKCLFKIGQDLSSFWEALTSQQSCPPKSSVGHQCSPRLVARFYLLNVHKIHQFMALIATLCEDVLYWLETFFNSKLWPN